MAILNVNPTRMELTKLKARLVTASRGHKLLKDKQDELMRRFIEMIRRNKVLREQVEKELIEVFKEFLVSSAIMSPEFLEQAVALPKEEITVDIQQKNVMSVNVPVMNFVRKLADDPSSIYPYGYAQTSSELDDAISRLYAVMPQLLDLAEVEKSCQLMADEIEKTRRRVNALEYRTIPELQETIKFIRMKLDENERATITRLMKVKDMIQKN
ncbi:MAG: V-type ATP synthase subunit D [Clostridium sp.]|nr:V-type ATP synthase subunit D [Clostridium sp.]